MQSEMSKVLKQITEWRTIAAWWGLCVVYLLLSVPTLLVSPSIYPDEVQILDYGRGVFEPDVEWTVVWNVLQDRATISLRYIGVALSEAGYRLGGGMPGVRLVGLMSGVLAATVFFFWARAAGVRGWLAWLVAAAFLTDPLAVAVSRSGRVDLWAIFFALSACWLLRASGRHAALRLVGAGVAVALSAMTWTTAIYLAPLVVAELWAAPALRAAGGKLSWRITGWAWSVFALSAALALAFLLWVRAPFLPQGWLDFVTMAGAAAGAGSVFAWWPFVESFRANFLLLPLALAGAAACWRTNPALVLAGLATTLLMIPSNVYHFRAIYCLPIYYALVAIGASAALGMVGGLWTQRVVAACCGILLFFNAGVSMALRSWIGWQRAEANRPEKLLAAARDTVGSGATKVYDANMCFYYAGRELGWRMYRPLFAGLDPAWSDERFAAFLSKVDVAIVPVSDERRNMERFSRDEKAVLRASGFTLSEVVHVNPPESKPSESKGWWDRVLLGGGPSYGSYEIYRKTPAADPADEFLRQPKVPEL